MRFGQIDLPPPSRTSLKLVKSVNQPENDGYRLYRRANLAVRKRKRGKRPVNERVPLRLAPTVNEVWSMDYVSDSLACGRRLKYLTVADDFTHESVDIAVDFGISGQYVTRAVDRAALFRGYPKAVRTDNGPEFTSKAFMAWAQTHGIRHILIQPGRPMQNGYIERFNGKFRDEHLNESWFETLHQARTSVAIWRTDYNEVRPHSSLGCIPPARFAELLTEVAPRVTRVANQQIALRNRSVIRAFFIGHFSEKPEHL